MNTLGWDLDMLVEDTDREIGKLSQGSRRLTVRPYPSMPNKGFSFWAPEHFAWVIVKTRKGCLSVGTPKQWAVKAGVGADWYSKGDHGRDSANWQIPNGGAPKRKQVAKDLARVCQARHGALSS